MHERQKRLSVEESTAARWPHGRKNSTPHRRARELCFLPPCALVVATRRRSNSLRWVSCLLNLVSQLVLQATALLTGRATQLTGPTKRYVGSLFEHEHTRVYAHLRLVFRLS